MAFDNKLFDHLYAQSQGFRDGGGFTAVDNAARAYGYNNAQEAARAMGFSSVDDANAKTRLYNTTGGIETPLDQRINPQSAFTQQEYESLYGKPFDVQGYFGLSPEQRTAYSNAARGTRFENDPISYYQQIVQGNANTPGGIFGGLDPSMEGYQQLKDANMRSSAQNAAALQASNEQYRAQAKARQASGLGRKIAGIAGGVVGAGLGASALGLLGTAVPAAASSAPATGLSAGGAVASSGAASGGGGLSSLVPNFSLSGAAKGAITSGLTGAATGQDPLKSAAIGGLTGGIASGIAGKTAGTALDKASGVVGAQGPTQGSGILGALTRNIPSGITNFVSDLLPSQSGASGMNIGLSDLAKPLMGYYSYKNDKDILNQAIDAQMNSQNALMQQFAPYGEAGLAAQKQLADSLAAGFTPGDLASDPGYQFRLEQGSKALNRSLASQGMANSGRAIKAAQEYGQGLAANEYAEAYRRWLQGLAPLQQQANQGYSAAQNIGNAYANLGNIQAQGIISKGNNRNNYLSSLISGLGLV